jgi:uncharacterized protein YndB with AHSA1/START domain
MPTATFTLNKNKLEVEIERVFNAPIEKVWKAHFDPELVTQWWGPRFLETKVETLEAKKGGKWRILHLEKEGREHWFSGEFKVVDAPHKFVRTFVYEPASDHVITETTYLESTPDGRTKLRTISKFPSEEALNGMVNSGMEFGARESLERLSELVEGK